mmetsp:Transcript_11202/g.15633  ORF Transcript_11202/g.15633 Transcript_11202/m.15633 type:complete len:526 (-) Transcript_11202:201-1778(-)
MASDEKKQERSEKTPLNSQKARPLLKDEQQNRYLSSNSSEKTLRGIFALSPKGKDIDVILSSETLLVGDCSHSIADIVGASEFSKGVLVHSYPRRTPGCCTEGGSRHYKRIRLYTPDKKVSKHWSVQISRVARGQTIGNPELKQRNILFYVNPLSGPGKSMQQFESVRSIFENAGIKPIVVKTQKPGQVRAEIAKCNLERWDGIVIVSGDGLIVEYVNGIMDRPDWEKALLRPFGCLPGGSGNGLASAVRHESGDTYDLTASAFLIAKGNTREVDMVSWRQPGVKPLYGTLSLSWGLISDIDLNSEACRCCGSGRFVAYATYRSCCPRSYYAKLRYVPTSLHHGEVPSRSSGIQKLKSSHQPGVITSEPDPEVGEKDSFYYEGLNSERKTLNVPYFKPPQNESLWNEVKANVFTFLWAMGPAKPDEDHIAAPDAKIGDGRIHLVYLEGNSCWSSICTLLRLEEGTQLKDPKCKILEVEALELIPDFQRQPKGLYSVDGERVEHNDKPIMMEVYPRALTVFCGGPS